MTNPKLAISLAALLLIGCGQQTQTPDSFSSPNEQIISARQEGVFLADSHIAVAAATAMEQQARDGFSGIIYLSIGDELLLHRGYGLADRKSNSPMTPETVISSGSLSKQITATAAVTLHVDGELSLDDPLTKFFDDVPTDKAQITLRQLLSHTSGINGWAFPDDFTPITTEQWLELIFSTPLDYAPGERFSYSNDGFSLVALAVEKTVGQSFRSYIKDTYFTPLGMSHTGWFDDEIFDDPSLSIATGYFNGKDDGAPNEWSGPFAALMGNGGILWTPSDMAKWHKAIHKGDFLSNEERSLLFTPVVEIPERDEFFKGEIPPSRYALGWRISNTECIGRGIVHSGAGISHNVSYRYFPELDALLYVASNKIDQDYNYNETFYSKNAAVAVVETLVASCKNDVLNVKRSLD